MRRDFGLHHAAAAITTFAPPMETFSKGRGFAAWVGLTPRQHSSSGKERPGRTSTMGPRDIRRFDERSIHLPRLKGYRFAREIVAYPRARTERGTSRRQGFEQLY